MTEDTKPQIRPWMVIVGLVVAGLAFMYAKSIDQQNRDWYACQAGDYSKCDIP